MGTYAWTLQQARDWLRQNVEWFDRHGFTFRIVGSVATKGHSLKDLDILLLPKTSLTLKEALDTFYSYGSELGLTDLDESPLEAGGHEGVWFFGAYLANQVVEFFFDTKYFPL